MSEGGYRIVPCWRLSDPRLEQEALEFWNRFGILPPSVHPRDRVRELLAAAYDGEEMVGVATAQLATLPVLRARFAHFRCAVAKDHRGEGIAVQLTRFSKPLLERWSAEHPEEEVMGMTTILEGYKAGRNREPYWPATGLTLIGYTQHGYQVRAVWFAHARVG